MEAKKIIITGGATRIGAAIARSLAEDATDITIHYNTSASKAKKIKKELDEFGIKIHLLKCNLKKEKEVTQLIRKAKKQMGGLDCLINNASIFENDDISNFNSKSWEKHISVNLKSPSILMREFFRLTKNKPGNIINIIDQRIFKLTPFFFSYSVSKYALAAVTKISAMKFAPNIRVNGIAPGPTMKNKRQSKKHFKSQWKSTILEKQVDVNNICNLVKYFIENDSVTGQIMSVDSGQSLGWKTPDIIRSKE